MLGIIGGTGLYELDGIEQVEKFSIDTPFGAPSAEISIGHYGDTSAAFLPRHGAHHQYLPSEVNYRANIWALKSAGVTSIVGVSAVGSLKKELEPGHFALPSQYIDLTKGKRESTFFGGGLTGHVPTANPICSSLQKLVADAASKSDVSFHNDETYVCIEGPRFGTAAESRYLQTIGGTLVGMTNVPEVFLAREAQMRYCTLCIITDYDSWPEDDNYHPSTDDCVRQFKARLSDIKPILKDVITSYQDDPKSEARSVLDKAVLTPFDTLSEEKKELFAVLKI